MNKRINISMDENLINKIDQMAEILYTSRSALISVTMAKLLKVEESAMGIVFDVTDGYEVNDEFPRKPGRPVKKKTSE